MAIEDPLPLDHERMDPMITSAQKISKNIEIMNSLIGSVGGELTCSYSSFDTVENRERYPATLFHRLRENVSSEGVDHVGFIMEEPGHFIDGNDYWMHKGVHSGAIFCGDVREQPEEASQTPMWKLSEQMSEKVLSASSLSDFLSCKHKFFLKNILRLREIRAREFDTLGWLTSLETGTIYHAIFEKFLYHAMENPGILENEALAIKGISIIAEAEIARCEEELPTASSFHTERQRKEVLENAARFAAGEVEKAPERRAVKVEMAFGMDEPLAIRLGEGRRIKASGFIDRIDITKDGDVGITDYKTGSKWIHEDLQEPQVAGITEANAQLALYYLALKELAGVSDDPDMAKLQDITSMSYQFVTAKGEYDTISMRVYDDSEKIYKAAFTELVDEIEKGLFPPEKGAVGLEEKDRKPNCRYCGYAAVCVCSPETGVEV
jgi:RecB family exonuclease